MKTRNKLLIWPIYFDLKHTWAEGRRVPKKNALRNVKIEEIQKAAEELGLNPLLKIGATYSRKPWLKSGVVLVDREYSKTLTLNKLSERIRLNRLKNQL